MHILTPDRRLEAFSRLGLWLEAFCQERQPDGHNILDEAIRRSATANPWFIPDFILCALKEISSMLQHDDLVNWLTPYRQDMERKMECRNVAVVMAGNIPAVGFHDYLSVLISGNKLTAKISASDSFLIPALHQILICLDPGWEGTAHFTSEVIRDFDAAIATGSNNSARYFEYYFRNHRAIIRKNRTSIAILTGNEEEEMLEGIAADAMLYFGLGCRSVNHLLLPEGFVLSGLNKHLERYNSFLDHSKFRNNHDYYRSVFLVNNTPFHSAGPAMLIEDTSLSSPVSVINYSFYKNNGYIDAFIRQSAGLLQSVVTSGSFPFPVVLPGHSHKPRLWDYADGVDTLRFLLE